MLLSTRQHVNPIYCSNYFSSIEKIPLLFTQLCDLLSALESISQRDPPLLPGQRRQKHGESIKSWFRCHPVSVHSDINAVALLSALFPIKKTDRVYLLQPPALARSLRGWLRLGSSRWAQLDQWQHPGRGDLGNCVERVLQQAEFPQPHNKDRVSLEQVDDALATVAARCRFSAPKARARGMDNDTVYNNALEHIYQRLQSREAKWFTRMILKDYCYVELPENLVYNCIDPRLRVAMQMYHDFESAIGELKNLPASQMNDPDHGGFTQQCMNDVHLLPPKVGIKVGPPKWIKAKGGVKHAISVIDRRTMSVERKYDGEYCQIHIDLAKGEDCIQIFSKSGKDSTEDRRGVHQAIKDGLRIGRDDCKFSRKCILEGELLVYSDQAKEILDFHKIRKHVSRSGSFLGTGLDSQPHPWEHLMIMFDDVMLLDDEPILHLSYKYRRRLLERLVSRIEGRADLTWHARVRFDKPEGVERLQKSLALAFVRRWEGLVLKPFDEPYFDLSKPVRGRFPSRWIKLKKDCIKGLGDTADFAVVGGGYDVRKSKKYCIPNLRWTHFYIGCLRNKEGVFRFGEKPHFLVFEEISDCIRKEDMKVLNEQGYIRALEPDDWEARSLFDFEYASGIPKMKTVFKDPFVFDVAGSGFDKSPNREIFTLRFPRVMKIHWDRTWKDAVGLDELQALAHEARTVPIEEDFERAIEAWEEKLSKLDRRPLGQSNSWDHSDEEEDEKPELFPEQYGEVIPQKAQRRSRAPAAPPLIRMDTGEIQEGEHRADSGEVIQGPPSNHSIASITSDGSLKTPPTTSPFPKIKNTTRQQTFESSTSGHLHGKARKRSADAANMLKVSKKLKMGQLDAGKQTNIRPKQTPRDPLQARSINPLQEITNSARPSVSSSSSKSVQESKCNTATEFGLVRKISLGSEVHINHLRSQSRYRPKRIMEPSSPAKETTASESTSTNTTQQTTYYDAVETEQSPPVDHEIQAPQLLTPPSTANPPLKIKLPDLQESKIVLSPSLFHNRIPIDPLNDYLKALSVKPSSFRKAWLSPNSANIHCSTPKETTQIILLMDQSEGEHIGWCMRKLLKCVRMWHPLPFAVWDWRVLDVIDIGIEGYVPKENEMSKEEFIKAHFYAKMTWNAEAGSQGAVETVWTDGISSNVLWEDVDAVMRRR